MITLGTDSSTGGRSGRSDEERLAARQERSLPVLKRLGEYLGEHKGLALPKSQFGKAINYALNQWEALLLYASDGRLEIDNVIASYYTSCTGFRFSLLAARRPSLLRVPAEHIVARILIQPMLPVATDRTDEAGAA